MNNEQTPSEKPQDNAPKEWDRLLSGEDDGLTEAERVQAAAVHPFEAVSGMPDKLLIKNYKEAVEEQSKAQARGDGEISRYWQEQQGKYAKEMSPEALKEARGF